MKKLISLAVVVAFFVTIPQCLGQDADQSQLLEEQQLVQMWLSANLAAAQGPFEEPPQGGLLALFNECTSDLDTAEVNLGECVEDLGTAEGELMQCGEDLDTAEGLFQGCLGSVNELEGELDQCVGELDGCVEELQGCLEVGMLLDEFQKQHRQIQELKERLAQLEQVLTAQQSLAALTK